MKGLIGVKLSQKKYVDYTEERSLGSLRHSRAVVHTQDLISTGVINYVEGDLIEVELVDSRRFQLGDRIHVSIYSTFGLMHFETAVIAVGDEAIIVLHPPELKRRWSLKEKREFVRVSVAKKGIVKSAFRENGLPLAVMDGFSVQLDNVSLGGIGFCLGEEEGLPLSCNDTLTMEVELGDIFLLSSQIVQSRKIAGENSIYVGAKFVDLDPFQTQRLKSAILYLQINQYYNVKGRSKIRLF